MVIVPLLLTVSHIAAPTSFYIGTYTDPKGSKGIYHATLDPTSGAISTPKLVAEVDSPSFLAKDPKGKYLFACLESTNGSAASYAIQPDGSLKTLGTQNFNGLNACHLTTDIKGQNLLLAAYTGGTVVNLPIKDGRLLPPTVTFQNAGSGPDKSRQEKPHMHSIYVTKDGTSAYACDLGTDEIIQFALDSARGTIEKRRSVKVAGGSGPRHLAFSKNDSVAYVCNEMLLTVSALSRGRDGVLTEFQTISTVPEGTPKKGNSTAEIFVHPNGKTLYVSNRGHNSIAVFKIDRAGRLTLLEIKPVETKTPRGFAIDGSGKWLVVGGQGNNLLVSYPINADGSLGERKGRVEMFKPVCVLF